MGISKKFQSLLLKGVVLASMLALLAGAVGTVYAQSSSGSSKDTNDTSFDQQQEALWVARDQNLVTRVNAILPKLEANGRDTTKLRAALEDLQNVLIIQQGGSSSSFGTSFVGTAGIARWADDSRLANRDDDRALRVALRGAYNQTKREYNQLRAAFPSDFAGVSNNGLASTGTTSTACASATAVPTAVPATGGCAAPVSVPTATTMPTAVPATGSTCGTPNTGGTSSTTAAATSTPMATSVMTATATVSATAAVSATATAMPTATAAVSATATAMPTAVPATGSTCTCGTPSTGMTATAVPTAVPATGSCGTPNTGAVTFTTFDQFQAFVWSNHAASLVARVNSAINAGNAAGVSTSDMQRDLPAVQDLLTVSSGSQDRAWRNSLQSAYWILKHDFNVFRADNPSLISTSTTGVANTGGTSSTSSTSTCGAAAPTAVPATGSTCTTKP